MPIPANMVRWCAGGEHPDDAIADLDQALTGVDGRRPRRIGVGRLFCQEKQKKT